MGIMFPVMTSALWHVDPLTFTSLPDVTAANTFLVQVWVKEGRSAFRLKGEPIVLAWLLGSIGFCGFGFFVFLGQLLAGCDGSLTASIMMATQPMTGLNVNSIVRRVMAPLYSFLFTLMSFAGVTLIVTPGDIAALLSEPQHYSANALEYTTITTWLGVTMIIEFNALLFALRMVPIPTTATLIAIVPHPLYMAPVEDFVVVLFWSARTEYSPRSILYNLYLRRRAERLAVSS
jgi:drug/metabolite transporter (DMT)-like permease